jgi:tetratricopeptide (TPR) repeat protein/predicted Ser/Thr protein kinase
MHLGDDTMRSNAMPPRAMDRGLDSEAMRRRIASRLFGEPAEPVRVGRFRVTGKLGEGGMGVVLAAIDEDLDRPVAVKIVGTDRLRSDSDEHDRLVREARALAKLSHPNVVQVYEVGEYEGGVFIAMELVHGTNLRQWLAAERRTQTEILERFLAAARGLAAAHRVGVVHRDFKPSNALVGEDDRVRIADFGLARGMSHAPSPGHALSSDPGASSTFSSSRRSAVGTPAYMSPEQLRGAEVDERSDQYSFCVALYEAVHGQRPEVTRTASITRTGETTRPVPRWLRRVLARGLALRPEDRHPSMAAVIDALQTGPRRRETRLKAATLGLALATAVAAGSALTRQPPRELCPDPQAQLNHVWDADQRQAVRTAFTTSRLAYAAPTHARIERALDAYAARWVAARREACEATWIRGDQPQELHDDSVRCLDSARTTLANRVRVLAAADQAIVADADTLVAALPSPEHCRDAQTLAMQRHHVARAMDPTIAADLDRARVHFQIRQGREAVALLQHVLAQLHTAGDAAGEAEALLLLGKTQSRVLHEPASATHTLDQAYDRATTAQRSDLTWDIWTEQAWIRAGELDEAGEGRRLLGHARSALQSLHTSDPLPETAIQAVEATILKLEDRPDEALRLRRSIVDTLHAELVADHPDILIARDAYADALAETGAVAEARTLHHEIMMETVLRYGADHPLTARHEVDLGHELLELGEHALARKHLEHARDVFTATFGERYLTTATAELGLAMLDAAADANDGAIAHAEAALAILDDSVPRAHVHRLIALTLLLNFHGVHADRHGDYGRVLEVARELLDLHEATDNDAIELPVVLINIGEALCAMDRCGEALHHYQRLASLYERTPPEEPILRAFPLRGIGLAHLAAGHPALALPFLEQAYELLRTLPHDRDGLTMNLAVTARDLARALAETHQSPQRVRSLRKFADSLAPAPGPPRPSGPEQPPRPSGPDRPPRGPDRP